MFMLLFPRLFLLTLSHSWGLNLGLVMGPALGRADNTLARHLLFQAILGMALGSPGCWVSPTPVPPLLKLLTAGCLLSVAMNHDDDSVGHRDCCLHMIFS